MLENPFEDLFGIKHTWSQDKLAFLRGAMEQIGKFVFRLVFRFASEAAAIYFAQELRNKVGERHSGPRANQFSGHRVFTRFFKCEVDKDVIELRQIVRIECGKLALH